MPLTIESAARKDKRNATGATFEHRHFAAIAAVLDSLHGDEIRDREQPQTWTIHEVATAMASAFAASNPRFDRARFLAACGF